MREAVNLLQQSKKVQKSPHINFWNHITFNEQIKLKLCSFFIAFWTEQSVENWGFYGFTFCDDETWKYIEWWKVDKGRNKRKMWLKVKFSSFVCRSKFTLKIKRAKSGRFVFDETKKLFHGLLWSLGLFKSKFPANFHRKGSSTEFNFSRIPTICTMSQYSAPNGVRG